MVQKEEGGGDGGEKKGGATRVVLAVIWEWGHDYDRKIRSGG